MDPEGFAPAVEGPVQMDVAPGLIGPEIVPEGVPGGGLGDLGHRLKDVENVVGPVACGGGGSFGNHLAFAVNVLIHLFERIIKIWIKTQIYCS